MQSGMALRVQSLFCDGRSRKRTKVLIATLAIMMWQRHRLWKHRDWGRGLLLLIIAALRGTLAPKLPAVKRDVHTADDGEQYCVWWLSHAGKSLETTSARQRVWVLIPGGMSDGNDFYIQQFAQSPGVAQGEDMVVFHPPGQGGTRWKRRFGHGFTDTSYLHHFLKGLASYSSVAVVGFSAGGLMTVRWAKEAVGPQRVSAVTICSPENMIEVFDKMSSGIFRLDVFLALYFHMVMRKSGLHKLVRFKRFPWPPTWRGYIKPFSEHCFALEHEVWRPFEAFVQDEFAETPDAPTRAPLLRVLGAYDPIVPRGCCAQTSEHTALWFREGSHCDLFYWRPETGLELRRWVLEAERVVQET
ncbi:unnamed protein product [Polarella glacialis]|uniref:AB hydrolase-1 domain-containing protein n=1 Tax=Polarella glacialis TaxID=89957 RepID=A0A813K618_POLGL|nr:unnamed protein product [Polarella glacialis]